MDGSDALDFMSLALDLKKLPRTGWVQSGVESPESVADHSYATALLAMVLSDSRGMDTLKVVRMALLHDLAEAITGDLTPPQKKEPQTVTEDDAMKLTLGRFPPTLAEMYGTLWDEYRAGESSEARLVYAADKIEMLIQALDYENCTEPGRLDRFWLTTVPEEYAETAKKLKKVWEARSCTSA